MTAKRTDRIRALLKGIETGDPAAAAVVSPDRYIQHNPQTHEGGEGLAALFNRLSKTNPRVNIVRAFEDGDTVFAHTEYDFASRRIGFEVFRFEGDLAVEHWDNIQPRQGPNPSGHTMVDGPTEATDLARTEPNRNLVRSFVDDILINSRLEKLDHYIDDDRYTQHNPRLADGLPALRAALETPSDTGITIQYDRIHRVLAEGNFVLAVSEGSLGGVHSAFYDLFRVAEGKLVEHWDTIEAIPPRSEWKNENGKF
ncbi:MAG: SnoaL-like domain-containing protein [Inquilinus sp.]|nr:SnoaL-like domain-containing protein [Inquilinus sp.]